MGWVPPRFESFTILHVPLPPWAHQPLVHRCRQTWWQSPQSISNNDPLLKSWVFVDQMIRSIPPGDLVDVRKDSVHFYDTDSAEINLTKWRHNWFWNDFALIVLWEFVSEGRNHDAPEMNVAVQLYKQNPDTGNQMTAVLTWHIGLEALRFVRASICKARRLALHIPSNGHVQRDVYGRFLLNFVDFLVDFASRNFRTCPTRSHVQATPRDSWSWWQNTTGSQHGSRRRY